MQKPQRAPSARKHRRAHSVAHGSGQLTSFQAKMSISEILTLVGQGNQLPDDFALTNHPDSFQNNERFFEEIKKIHPIATTVHFARSEGPT
jgi:hypothetical protein